MKLLYSDILPIGIEEGQTKIADCFFDEAGKSDGIEIAVGYISKAALKELDTFVEASGLKNILLIIEKLFVKGIFSDMQQTYKRDQCYLSFGLHFWHRC